jgi:hypothetical protein
MISPGLQHYYLLFQGCTTISLGLLSSGGVEESYRQATNAIFVCFFVCLCFIINRIYLVYRLID